MVQRKSIFRRLQERLGAVSPDELPIPLVPDLASILDSEATTDGEKFSRIEPPKVTNSPRLQEIPSIDQTLAKEDMVQNEEIHAPSNARR